MATTERRVIRVKHIVNSLYQIEKWTRAVRSAVEQLDQEALVEADASAALFYSPQLRMQSCPPPRPVEESECDDDPKKKKKKKKDKDKKKGKKKAKGRQVAR